MVLTQYAPVIGGTERQAQAVGEGLSQRGCEVAVLTQPAPGAAVEETINGVRVLRRLTAIPFGPLWGLTFLYSANRSLARLGKWADVIHCHEIYLHAAAAGRRRKSGGPPVVCQAVSSGPEGDLARMKRRKGGGRLMLWVRGADRVIATTSAIKKEFLEHGFSDEKITLLPNLVDTDRFAPSPEPPGDEWLFVGRLERLKGADQLLRALSQGGRKIKIAFAGDGPQRQELEELAGDLNLTGRVRFLGKAEDPCPLFARARGVILPSRAEGLSNVMLEALSCGKPVIATDVGGARDVLLAGRELPGGGLEPGYAWTPNGILARSCDPSDLAAALEAAESAPERFAQCGAGGREAMLSGFSKNAILDRLQALYASVAG
jgi:glycosyltransferase involved in cell wall biosynthesis